MKGPGLIFLLSVVANLALGAALAWHHAALSDRSAPLPVSPAAVQSTKPTREVSSNTAATWASIESGAGTTFVARLRAEGFPPAIIRALVTERLKILYADRLRAYRPKNKDLYWRTAYWRLSEYGDPTTELTPADRAARRAILREKDQALKQALGDDYESLDPVERAVQRRRFGELPSDKVAQIKAIDSDYKELAEQIRDPLLKEDRDQRRLLDAEERADLAAILSPAELLEYDLRSSLSASTIQNKFSNFNATEEEFRALTRIQLEFDQQYGTHYLSNEEKVRRSEAEKQLDAKFQSVLTPERFAEYQFVTDPAYQPTDNFVRNFNYESALTRQIVTLQRSINQRAETVRQQFLNSPAQRDEGLTTLYGEASAQISTMLSAKAYEAYAKDDAGRWLTQLKSPTGQPAPAKSP